MFRKFKNGMLAICAGGLLAMMVDSNGLLAHYSSSVFSSWVAHGVGAVVALLFVQLLTRSTAEGASVATPSRRSPLWFYLGGIPGAFTVILAAQAINGPLSLSGAIALMMLGQVLFGLLSDHFGWLRRIGGRDLLTVACILLGSGVIIFGG